METNDLDNFSEISIDSESFESDGYLSNRSTRRYRPTPKRLLPLLRPINFEKYLKENCQQKVKVLQRSTFHTIRNPIIIFFNHFREKCAYHTNCINKLLQLALKYGKRIEFIAADMLDIDILNSKWHSIDLFCSIGHPEKVSSLIYAIDGHKRIKEHSAEKDYENLTKLCDDLLQGRLFTSEILPEPNNQSMIKICVHENYEQLVTNSSKHVLLIVDLQNICECMLHNEINYEIIAEQLAPYNINLVYINAEKNYIPFELGISNFPAFVLFTHGDKKEIFEPLIGSFTVENIVNCVKSYFENPQEFLKRKVLELRKSIYQPLDILHEFKLDFENLQQYLLENCYHYLKVFDRETFLRSNRFVIIAFMDFQNGQCLAHHFEWIDKIYQVAINLSSPREYFVADFKDIDVINPDWKALDFRRRTKNGLLTPKVFGIDLNKNKFVLKDFKNAASLFYFAYSLTNGELYISEPWPNINEDKLVKTCIADGLDLSLTSVNKNIFLAIYYSDNNNYTEFLQILEDVARELAELPIKVMKIDSRINCISLDLDNSIYPTMYFIPRIDKSKRIPFPGDNYSKENIVEFIKQNIEAV